MNENSIFKQSLLFYDTPSKLNKNLLAAFSSFFPQLSRLLPLFSLVQILLEVLLTLPALTPTTLSDIAIHASKQSSSVPSWSNNVICSQVIGGYGIRIR